MREAGREWPWGRTKGAEPVTRTTANMIVIGACGAFVAGCVGTRTTPMPAAVERIDRVTLRGKPLTLLGTTPQVGQPAPDFTAVATDMSTFRLSSLRGRVVVLSAVPSLDTRVCSLQRRRFNKEAAALGPDVAAVTVTMDLPFAQKRWCAAEGIENVRTVSDYRDRAFGRAYGVLIDQTRLLARSVFVIGRDGRIRYVQIVPELTDEPQYAPVLAAARAAVKQ